MAAKQQLAAIRQKEAEAMASKRQAETEEERDLQDAQAKAAKRHAETEQEKFDRRQNVALAKKR